MIGAKRDSNAAFHIQDIAKAPRRASYCRLAASSPALGGGDLLRGSFALFIAGVSGAWIGNLTRSAYQPVFVGLQSRVSLRLLFRLPQAKAAIAPRALLRRPVGWSDAKMGLWVATILTVIAVGFPTSSPFPRHLKVRRSSVKFYPFVALACCLGLIWSSIRHRANRDVSTSQRHCELCGPNREALAQSRIRLLDVQMS